MSENLIATAGDEVSVNTASSTVDVIAHGTPICLRNPGCSRWSDLLMILTAWAGMQESALNQRLSFYLICSGYLRVSQEQYEILSNR